MPGIINSAPDCVTHVEEASADDMADFILQANYQDCAGFMTFGPGSTYGDEGAAAATSYYVLIGIGGVVMVAAFLIWISREPGAREVRTRTGTDLAGGGEPMIHNGDSNRQIEFPPLQTHVKRFEYAMIAISIVLAIIVLVIVLFTSLGNEFRPSA